MLLCLKLDIGGIFVILMFRFNIMGKGFGGRVLFNFWLLESDRFIKVMF